MIQRLAKGVTVTLLLMGLSGGIAFGWRHLSAEPPHRIDQSRIITIGYAIEAPYAFLDKKGTPTGESPALAKLVISRLGPVKVEWRLTTFSNLIPELLSDRIDIIAAGMFINDDRSKLIAFSSPTFHVTPAFLVRSAEEASFIRSGSAFLKEHESIAVVSGSVEEKLLLSLGMRKERLITVPDALTGKAAVRAGLVKAMMLSAPTLNWIVKNQQDANLAVVPAQKLGDPRLVLQGYGGFGFRKSDQDLIHLWNKAMQDVIGSETHLMIVKPFGFNVSNIRFTMNRAVEP